MNLQSLLEENRAFFRSGTTTPAGFRREQLKQLRRLLVEREGALLEALHADLGKPPKEAYVSEIGPVLLEIDRGVRNVRRWTRPIRRRAPLGLHPARCFQVPQPLGVVLIIGPWNYPLQLMLIPLVSAMAAGNCAWLKPSELAPHVASVLTRLLGEAFDPRYIRVTGGDRTVAEELLRLPFDHVFFTGSTAVGRKVMQAAAAHPAPVTLELGGKSPCILCADAPLRTATRRILWGKFLNAGQTCVAPDFLLVHASIRQSFLDAAAATLREFYTDTPRTSPDYGRIVNRRHFDRLLRLLQAGTPVCGGETDRESLYIAPTILTGITWEDPVMQEEIFGPILPVLTFERMDEVLDSLRTRPKPLALYLFTRDRAVQRRVLLDSYSGAVAINDTVNHANAGDLPFGGVGASGMGAYHGKAGFETFTHFKGVLRRSAAFDPGFQYPPIRVSLDALRRFSRMLFRG